jgi:hypothetical protein
MDFRDSSTNKLLYIDVEIPLPHGRSVTLGKKRGKKPPLAKCYVLVRVHSKISD